MKQVVNRALVIGLILGLVSCGPNSLNAPINSATKVTNQFSFVVLGDSPYNSLDMIMLDKAVEVIKAAPPPFVVHIGDYKSGGQACTKKHDGNFAALKQSIAPIPFFYTPGDNEWVDCDRLIDGKRFSELERLDFIRTKNFSSTPENSSQMEFNNQEEQPENATWVHSSVRFITIHVTGTNNARKWVQIDDPLKAENLADNRDAANVRWLEEQFTEARKENSQAVIVALHADMTDIDESNVGKPCAAVSKNGVSECDGFASIRSSLKKEVRKFERPVLLIHGDTAPFTLNQNLLNDTPTNLWRLNAAGDAGTDSNGNAYGVKDVTRVTVNTSNTEPFSAIGLTTGASPSP